MPEFIDAHGIAIVYDVHPARTEPRGIVQVLHGVGEHAGRYNALIETLTDAGYTVYADDHRGHGRTGMRQHGGDASKLGRLGKGGLRAAKEAIWQLTRIIHDDEDPGLPLILFGHSWGSFLAQMLVDEHPFAYDALVLSGSALRWPGSLNPGDLNAPWKTEEATGAEWLSSDAAIGQAFLDDPLTTSVPLLKLFGPLDALRLYGRPRRNPGVDLPVLLQVGRDDTVGGPRSVHRLADAYRRRSGFSDVTTLVYPDARHEIYNEVEQAQVRADLIAWLDARFPPRPHVTDPEAVPAP
ncbi:lysophospholipase [Microbacterium sp. zg.Y1090]|uniref:alpha/beta hydrolase n=1 Tax=Microbacterium TaxID=33882 RepID=UPI00214BDE51|nr:MULTISPECIES: alpha/beta hydrolase [unclassified Microbacterium]MCR2812312.1 lysophospholipase [Microbacterium sp. zg.Y1084]MCR2819798.1 lysophospholipase [Microbacterium sp. zg.Y1090]MDL5485469.1 alpha/beta hydrolase [Microbacterium sp. zg-Y1211]WIM28644.1 alpha/beta hydrolase [Microbacterium sp. zg-Y1090]